MNKFSAVCLLFMSGLAQASTLLIDYDGSDLPGPSFEDGWYSLSTHGSYSSDGSALRIVDNVLDYGSSSGFYNNTDLDPAQATTVQFRARMFAGESNQHDYTNGNSRGPFSVWLYDGSVRADMSIGVDKVTAGGGPCCSALTQLLDHALDGTQWHVYKYALTPGSIEWFVDGQLVGSAARSALWQSGDPPRINMFFTAASGDVEIDYLRVYKSVIPIPAAVWLFGSGLVALGWLRRKQS
jgi:hypothetical protein